MGMGVRHGDADHRMRLRPLEQTPHERSEPPLPIRLPASTVAMRDAVAARMPAFRADPGSAPGTVRA